MGEYYVYAYLDPRQPGLFTYPDVLWGFEYEPFYVGMGRWGRSGVHLWVARRIEGKSSSHKFNRIRGILYDGLEPIIVRVYENLDPEQAFEKERYLITRIGRRDKGTGPLTNLTDGGEGVLNPSEEMLDQRGKAISGSFQENYDRRVERMAQTINTPGLLERRREYRQSEEFRKIQSDNLARRWKNPDEAKMFIQASADRIANETSETRAYRVSRAVSPEANAKRSATLKKTFKYGPPTPVNQYILFSPDGQKFHVEKGAIYRVCALFGISRDAMNYSAYKYSVTEKLHRVTRGISRGWAAVMFQDIENVSDDIRSMFEGVTTIPIWEKRPSGSDNSQGVDLTTSGMGGTLPGNAEGEDIV